MRLVLSVHAKELLWGFQNAIEQAQAAGGAMQSVRAYASKAIEQACRLAGVLTLWDDLVAPEVTASSIAAGIKLAQYYLSEAKRLTDIGAVSVETARAEELRIWLLNTWPHDDFVPSDILQKGPGSLRERKILDAPLAMLLKNGWIRRLEEGAKVHGKSRKEAYHIIRRTHGHLDF